MGRKPEPDKPALADRPADVVVSPPERLVTAFRDYERFQVELHDADGELHRHTRDVLRGGRVAAVLPVDLARNEIVLIRQFRLPAHLATGAGEMIEVVAGRVEQGEDAAETARRECFEEIGAAPGALVELFSILPTAGITDELITFFLATVDATQVQERAGAADEGESIRPIRVPIDAALAALDGGRLHNGLLMLALQWLALNRHRLDATIKRG
jgi:ADP-ribose pyrophosphatase